ncbi:hypothetical protein GMOD_00009235 [Pyrenophora seminiperda CCB06]|uniref:Uncharacterized protein n=1 Tax=Pyrenophora seminiperda CCB06 TaxID=1302712 RepID=A0A3M7MC01_9PLEO|nr:hypothetical protein GMOD_00009235 [Pyrenophora seminiperda CCB06]
MGFQRNIRRINMGPATGKEKRGRRSRSKAAVLASELPKISESRSKTKASDVASDTREGASQSTPITLDSDDSEPIPELPKEHRRNAAMRKKALTSIHPAYEGSGLMYENRPLSSSEDDTPTKMQAAKGS